MDLIGRVEFGKNLCLNFRMKLINSVLIFKYGEVSVPTIKDFKRKPITFITTLIAIVFLNCNVAIAHETSESDVTKRCTVVKLMLDGLTDDEKFPTSELRVALTPKEISAAAGDISGHVPIALTAMVLVDGMETPISGNLNGTQFIDGNILDTHTPLDVTGEVPFDSKEVKVLNCTIYY
ncbi:hypothetical protein OAS89_01475 [Alphaproteobacteria bacterium]|nr:hypothetical protein [Alphaproteobacteria bacterium]